MNTQQTHVGVAQIPGVVMMNGQAYGQGRGHWYPVIGALRRGSSYISALDIPMMDERPNRKAAEV